MRRPRVKVILPRRLAEGFKRRAKASRVEVLGVLVGVQRGESYEITDIVYPEGEEILKATKYHLSIAYAVYMRAAEYGTVLGDIHSHPLYCDPAPSDVDWNGHNAFPLMAICSQAKDKAGRLCARIKFYPRLPIVDVRVA